MESYKGSIGRSLERAAEHYSNTGSLRALVVTIPGGIGSAIDAYIGAKGQEIQFKRLELLISEIENKIRNIGEEKIDKRYLESEDFYFLCKDIFKRVYESRSKTRISVFSNIFVEAVTGKLSEAVFAEICVDIADRLNELEIVLLSLVRQHNRFQKGVGYRGFHIDPDGSTRLANGEQQMDLANLELPRESMLSSAIGNLRREGLVDLDTQLTALGEDFIRFVVDLD